MGINVKVAERKRDADGWGRVVSHFCNEICRVASKWTVSPGEILAAGRRRTQRITRAREELLDQLERTVRFVDRDGKREYMIDTTGGSLDGWEPISRPDLGYLAGLNQSAVTLSLHRRRNRTQDAAVAKETALPYAGAAL